MTIATTSNATTIIIVIINYRNENYLSFPFHLLFTLWFCRNTNQTTTITRIKIKRVYCGVDGWVYDMFESLEHH